MTREGGDEEPLRPTHVDREPDDEALAESLAAAFDDELDASSAADSRMADLLADGRPLGELRRDVGLERTDDSDDLLQRINALDYLNTLVGEVGGDIPEQLGEYRITGLLGRGGMGTVFAAFQESLEREVALKVLAPSLTADPKMRKRFRSEARANASLHHQHIVPVFDFGEAGGFLYFAMERVIGVSLDKQIANARRRGEDLGDPREWARRFAGVADALSHAHKRRILHRDVKPGNILVHADGSLALADFGLMKMLGVASMSLSHAGGFLGTLHYAPPEQARGQTVTEASDLYSLGVTLFEAVTGTLPLSGKTTEGILQSILHEPPQRLRDVLPKAPKDLDAVLRKLLAKDPGDRYLDGAELARDLLRVADEEPVRIRRQSLVVLGWRRVRKHPWMATAVGVAMLLLLMTLGLWRAQALDRYERQLTDAIALAEREPGSISGPDGIVGALTGFDLTVDSSRDAVSTLLERAGGSWFDDGRADLYLAAYRDDPDPDCTRNLGFGRGRAAIAELDARIAELEQRSGFASRDAVTWLQLYRLYLARAVANLTAAVADPAAGEKDLLRAQLVRPGALTPQLLTAVLEWAPSTGADALFTAFDSILADVPTAIAARTAGSLFVAIAGLERPVNANLMQFDLPFATRRAIHRRGAELLDAAWGELATDARVDVAGSIESGLRDVAERLVASVGDLGTQDAALRDGRRQLDEIAGTSPLASWGLVYDLLENPTRMPDPTDAGFGGGRSWSSDVVLKALDDLLDLSPAEAYVERLWPGARRWLESQSDASVAVRRVRARFSARVDELDQARELAQSWVEVASDDPAAYVCRFMCHVRAGSLSRAATDGATALQLAVRRARVAQELVVALERFAPSDPAIEQERRRLLGLFASAVGERS